MRTMDDWGLLEAYAKDRSEPAFAELVRRHLTIPDGQLQVGFGLKLNTTRAQEPVTGVGLVLGVENHALKILNVLPNTPPPSKQDFFAALSFKGLMG